MERRVLSLFVREECVCEALKEIDEPDSTADMVDSTIVQAHQCAAGTKKNDAAEALDRSCGGFTLVLHARCDSEDRRFV